MLQDGPEEEQGILPCWKLENNWSPSMKIETALVQAYGCLMDIEGAYCCGKNREAARQWREDRQGFYEQARAWTQKHATDPAAHLYFEESRHRNVVLL